MTAAGSGGARLKRFYKSATVGTVSPGHGPGDVPGGYVVLLDGKQLKTPAGGPLVLASRGLAAALAEEWEAQHGDLDPREMPLMQLVSTALDRVAARREEVVDEIAGYGSTDMLCYRVEQPAELARRQQALWQPLVDWATLHYDAPLTVTTGILPQPQPEGALASLRGAVARLEPLALAGLHSAVTGTGSLLIGLALLEGRLDADSAWAAAQLEEAWQVEHWGEDAEAARRRAALRADLSATARFLALLRG